MPAGDPIPYHVLRDMEQREAMAEGFHRAYRDWIGGSATPPKEWLEQLSAQIVERWGEELIGKARAEGEREGRKAMAVEIAKRIDESEGAEAAGIRPLVNAESFDSGWGEAEVWWLSRLRHYIERGRWPDEQEGD